MRKETKYLILDTETATLPFVSEMELNVEQKKKVAIARPLVYDIGWVIGSRKNNEILKRNYLVTEIFSVPSIFNTAYYAEKRPLYIQMLRNKEIELKSWNEIIDILIADMKECSYVCAYNAMFDFCKAIPFTELYIKHLYSSDYQEWELIQKILCNNIANCQYKKDENKQFDNKYFHLREEKYPMIDIWGLACSNIINKDKYKKMCLEKNFITNSGTFFSTTAENTKRFLEQRFDFIESHTALSDAEIETTILFYGMKVGKRTEGIIYFPFRILGDTIDFALNCRTVTKEMKDILIAKMITYLGEENIDDYSNYKKGVFNKLIALVEWDG